MDGTGQRFDVEGPCVLAVHPVADFTQEHEGREIGAFGHGTSSSHGRSPFIGSARVDFGVPGLDKIGSPLHEIVLGDGCFYSYEHNRIGVGRGRTVTGFPLVFKTPLDSSGFLWEIGEAPSFRGPDGLDALTTVTVEFNESGLFRLPRKPPQSGAWDLAMNFRYYNGSRSRVVVPIPVEST